MLVGDTGDTRPPHPNMVRLCGGGVMPFIERNPGMYAERPGDIAGFVVGGGDECGWSDDYEAALSLATNGAKHRLYGRCKGLLTC